MPDDDRDEAEQGTGGGTAEGAATQATPGERFMSWVVQKGWAFSRPSFAYRPAPVSAILHAKSENKLRPVIVEAYHVSGCIYYIDCNSPWAKSAEVRANITSECGVPEPSDAAPAIYTCSVL